MQYEALKDHRPLQVVHDFEFTPMNVREHMGWDSHASEAEKYAYIRKRLTRLKELGFGGVVLNVAFADYMEDEAAWTRYLYAVDQALELGLRIWIYDEQYYPSGRAGGLTLRNHPEWESQALACVAVTVQNPAVCVRIQSPHGHGGLRCAYAVPLAEDGTPKFSEAIDITRFQSVGGGLAWDAPHGCAYRIYAYFPHTYYEGSYVCRGLRTASRPPCPMQEDATRHFLDITIKGYRERMGEERFAHVESFFTDEPGIPEYMELPAQTGTTTLASRAAVEQADLNIPLYPFLPWTAQMPDWYMEESGIALCPNLPEIFEGKGEHADTLREYFWRTTARHIDLGWSIPYREYAEANHVRYGGHFRGIMRFHGHPIVCGDILCALGRMHMPGCDHMDSIPETPFQQHDPKLPSSAAHLYGAKDVLCEISHMCNPNDTLTLEHMLCTAAEMYAEGITEFASYYGEHVISDAEYKIYTQFVRRLGDFLADGISQPEALLFLPYSELIRALPVLHSADSHADDRALALDASIHDTEHQLLCHQMDFDFVNAEMLCRATVSNEGICLPNGVCYHRLVFPEIERVAPDVAKIARLAARQNIPVCFAGKPRVVLGLEDVSYLLFGESIFSYPIFRADGIYPHLKVLRKHFPAKEAYLLVNAQNVPLRMTASIPSERPRLSTWNPLTDETRDISATLSENRLQFSIALPAYASLVVIAAE